MLLYINNKALDGEIASDMFYTDHSNDPKSQVKNSLLVGIGIFVNDFLTNAHTKEITKENKVYNNIRTMFSYIDHFCISNYFLYNNPDGTLRAVKPVDLKSESYSDPNTGLFNEMVVRNDERSDALSKFYESKRVNIQIFNFKGITIQEINVDENSDLLGYKVNLQFQYNKETGEMTTYLYNIEPILREGSTLETDPKELYRSILKLFDHIEVSFDLHCM